MSVDDFVVTHFTRGAGINTISTLIYSEVKIGIRPSLYALSTIIFLIALVALLIVNVNRDKELKEHEEVDNGFSATTAIAYNDRM